MRDSQPGCASWSGLSKCAHIIGVSVSETTTETAMDTATVTANSRNSSPTTPLIRNSGMNTAISDTEMDMMVKPISPAPFSAASIGDRPSSMWRTMFSIITIASSTTKPTAMVSAMSERLSKE